MRASIILILLTILAVIAFPIIFNSGNCETDEIWRERIDLHDGTHIMMYHNWDCHKNKPFFAPKEKKIDFIQMKADVFHSCFSSYEIKLLIDICRANERMRNKYLIQYTDEIDWQYERVRSKMIDTSYRQYYCFYSYSGDSVIPLDTPFYSTYYHKHP